HPDTHCSSHHTPSSYHPRTPSHPPPFPTRRSSDLLRESSENGARICSEPLRPTLENGDRICSGPPPAEHECKTPLSGRLILTDRDRKSTRLNSSHQIISYAVFCLKKKKDIRGVRVD